MKSYFEPFAKQHPKPVYLSEDEYAQYKSQIDEAAKEYGYQLAGFRLKKAVFSTKKREEL
jgi:hypothetical protein